MAPARSTAGLLLSLSTLAEERRLRMEDGGMNGGVDEEMNGGVNGEMDGDSLLKVKHIFV